MATEAPDGGWGYVVAGAAFFVAFFLDGLENSFGVLLPHLVKEFDVGIAVVTFCGGLITGVCLGIGPIVAILIKKFGCRPLAFGGGLLASLSLGVCTQAQSIAVFTIFYGVFAGCGIGLLYLPSITTVNTYFEKKRGVVVGLVTSGSGIGLFVMSLLIDSLIAFYGWRGCYLILSGIYLHLCVCAALLRPVHSKINQMKSRSRSSCCCRDTEGQEESAVPDESNSSKKDVAGRFGDGNLSNGLKTGDSGPVSAGGHGLIDQDNGECDANHSANPIYCNGSSRDMSEKPLLIVDVVPNDVNEPKIPTNHDPAAPPPAITSVGLSQYDALIENESSAPRGRANTTTLSDYKYTKIQPADRSHSSHPQLSCSKSNGSNTSLQGSKLHHRAKSSELLKSALQHDRHLKASSSQHSNLQSSLSVLNVPMECVSMTSLCDDANGYSPNVNGSLMLYQESQNGTTDSLPVSASQLSRGEQQPPTNPFLLLKIVRFDLFCGGAFLTQVALVVPAMLTPSYALSLGIEPSKAATIVSVLGIANTIGRFVAGLLAFVGIRSLLIYNTGIFLAGLTCFLIPFCTTHPSLIAFAACHGFFIGAFPPLQSVILVEQLGLHLLPASFGVLCLSKSFASVLGPTLAGALYSAFNDYVAPFYFTGGLLTIATILHGLMAFCPATKY